MCDFLMPFKFFLIISLAIATNLLFDSAALATTKGSLAGGTLIVVMPSKDGILVVSDRLLHSKTTDYKEESAKIFELKEKAIIGCVNGNRISVEVQGENKTIFSSSELAKSFICDRDIDLTKEFPAPEAFNLGKIFKSSVDEAFNKLENKDELLKPFDTENYLFGLLLIHQVKEKNEFQILAFNIFPPTSVKDPLIAKSGLKETLLYGRPEHVEQYAQNNPTSLISQSLVKENVPCLSWTWKKSVKVAAEMVKLTNLAVPKEVGNFIDVVLINNNGTVEWKFKNQSCSDVIKKLTNENVSFKRPT